MTGASGYLGESHGEVDLPKRCFASASYRDGAAVKKLRRSLPGDVEVITFPRAEPDPGRANPVFGEDGSSS